MIRLCQDIYSFDLDEALAAVHPQRRRQALRYRLERDQRLCIAAYRLLQESLCLDYGIDEGPPELIYDNHGKPLLRSHPEIHFSLSHCRDAAAIAIGDEPVGIDIENLDQYSEAVAQQVMSASEMKLILASPRPAREFIRLWTMKESLYKLTGDDNGGDIVHMLDDARMAYRFTTLDYPEGYLLTVCQAAAASPLHADGLNA
ncbi:MAG: 4'-phosphopantetheinyl transferase superfamily protein [Muribaculaceae bacterium]|nr:4'-phosphopantetheinyl transferase superfamily protein [Muribaculaceae bacterium]